jgi:hypothetical protein
MSSTEQRVGDIIAELDEMQHFKAALLGWKLIGTSSSTESESAACRDIDAWVEWLVETYEIRDWPSCWKQHGGLAQETIAMRLDHAGTIARRHPRDLVTWHDHLRALRLHATEVADRCPGESRCSRSTATK